MSLQGTTIIGVSGMIAQSNALSTISDNIANVNTVGYKAATTRFETLLQPHQGLNMFDATKQASGTYNTGGVSSMFTQQVDVNGGAMATSNPTNLSIYGRGFFQVARANSQTQSTQLAAGTLSAGAERLYTRDGSFNMSKDGLFLNTAGDALMGVAVGTGVDPTTVSAPSSVTSLVPVKVVSSGKLDALATSTVKLNINLPGNQTVSTAAQKVETRVFTSDGSEYTMVLSYARTADPTQWTVSLADVLPTDANEAKPTVTSTSATITFDPANSEYTSPLAGFNVGTFTTASGQTLSPTIQMKDTTGGLGASTVSGTQLYTTGSSQDGRPVEYRTGFEFSTDGTLTEIYPNGIKVPRFKVPLVSFVNNNVLDAERGSAYAQTAAAGSATIGFPSDSNNLGKIMSSTLENSTTDVANEFANMIVTERAYQANSKSIQVADEMTKDLTQLGV